MNLASLLKQHEAAFLCVLNRAEGLRSRQWPHLINKIQQIGTQVLAEGSSSDLLSLGLPKEAVAGWMSQRNDPDIVRTLINGTLADLDWLSHEGRHLVSRGSPYFPPLLEQIYDPPNLLFVHGKPEVLLDLGVAVVGARNPTLLGRERAFQFAERFAQAGVVTVSGLALGIDAQAHRGALHGKGKTVAVLAGGLEQLYPKQHRSLAHSISEHGAVISEMPVDLAAAPYLFPRRNRIISGLTIATVVIEAALRSGSLITAEFAMEHSRDLFAMPGSVLNPLAAGCHSLIRQGAGLVENADQVLEAIGCWSPALAQSVQPAQFETTLDQQRLLQALGYEPVAIDTLASRTGLSVSNLTQQLLELELEGQVQSCAGGFVRTS